MDKNEDGESKLFKRIENIQVSLSEMIPSHQEDISSLFINFKAEIKKILKKAKKKPEHLVESTAKGRPELSDEEMEILRDPSMKRFQVTYNYLHESCLRFCLVFLSIFPENAVIKKRCLIYWWIGEGLISSEEKGEKIFEELLKFELIIPYGNGMNPLVSKCTIHPWIRYSLISLAINSQLLCFDYRGVPRFDIDKGRACLLEGDEKLPKDESGDSRRDEKLSKDESGNSRRDEKLSKDESGNSRTILSNRSESKKDLKTIFNVNKRYVSFTKELANMEKLMVLQLGRWQDLPTHHIEVVNEAFLKDLRTQKHLKYLSLRGISRITALPDSIVELTNLEILDLKACHNLETLPKDISTMKKLTHLDVSECYLLESMPRGVDKLTSLEVLKGFVIGNSKQTPCRIQDLGKLKKLKRLSIHIGSEAVVQGGEFQKLKDLESVRRLKISWGIVVKESFSFPPSLEKLDIEGLPYKELPEWLVPSNLKELKKLYIKGGKLETLDHHDNEGTWKVEILRLHHLKGLKHKVEDLKQFFPSLKYGQIMNKDPNTDKEKSF